MGWVRERDWRSEERRLMPEYVEQFFRDACEQLGVRVERRADGALADRARPARAAPPTTSASVKRLGRPAADLPQAHLPQGAAAQAEHEDAVCCSPGHPLYAAVRRGARSRARSCGEQAVRAIRRTLRPPSPTRSTSSPTTSSGSRPRADRGGLRRARRGDRGARRVATACPPTCCTTSRQSTSRRETSSARPEARQAARTSCG